MALNSSTTKLQLPLRSLVEEWKVATARLYMTLWDSVDPLTRSVRPDAPAGKKWAVADAVEEAEGRLKHMEMAGAVQQDPRELGWRRMSGVGVIW